MVPFEKYRAFDYCIKIIINISKVQIGNKEPVPGSLLTIIGFILVSVFFYFINM